MDRVDPQVVCVLRLKELLQNRATSSGELPLPDRREFTRLRQRLVRHEDDSVRALMPSCVRDCRDLEGFWSHIRDDYPSYQSRRQYLAREFSPLLDYLEGIPPETEIPLFLILDGVPEWEAVGQEWRKACARLPRDPEGAITSARTLVETVCKHILDDAGIAYKPTDSLTNLYRNAAEQLNLTPKQHEGDVFKRLLGGAQTMVDGLASLRNDHGDAHGKGQKAYRVQTRHAELAVSLAASISTFMIETWQQRKT